MDNSIQDTDRQEDTISLLDLFTVIVKRRMLIIGTTIAAALLVLAVVILSLKLPHDSPLNYLPNYYIAEVKVILQESSSKMAVPNLSSTESALSYFLGGSISKDSNLALAEELLFGNTIKDTIIQEFNFYERYGLEDNPHAKTSARNIINQSLKVETGDSQVNGLCTIIYQDIDPVFAFEVLSSITDILEQRFKELTSERLMQKKEFIEDRLQIVGEELKHAQDVVAKFQVQYGIYNIASRTNGQNTMMADLQLEIIQKEMAIEELEEYLSKDDPRILRLKKEIENKNKFILELTSGGRKLPGEYIAQDKIPEIMSKYLNLKSEADIQKAIYTTLRQEYESVKIDEADNSKLFQVLEYAEIPEVKAGPSRSKICIIVTISAFFLAVFWAFVKEYFERVKKDPVESEKLAGIKAMLRLKKRR